MSLCIEAVGFNPSQSRLHGLVLHKIAGSPAAIDRLPNIPRSEKYSFVKPPPERNLKMEKLINFQGKLASVRSRIFDSEESLSLEILILKDPKKHEWAIRIFNLPPMWKDGAAGKYLDVVGVTATNELVLSPRFPSYLYYYNFVSKDISRVDIQGIGAFEKEPRAHVILNHVEDAKIMELF
ncbi:F-box protein DOR-like [Brassica napus]|uniref:F-box protein DOR-like n=1 Tax=Brassica napus TaxID=3708 RepID=UPI002078574B|nr:F-box protein DOR-like [Brassica napus]